MAYKEQIRRLSKSPLRPIGAAIYGVALASSLFGANDTSDKNTATTLKTVEVKENIELELPRYQPSVSKVGKTKQTVHEVPQAITVVTKELMKDQAQFTLKDAMKNVAGLTFNAAEGGRIGDNMNLRGFYTFGDMYLDGIRDASQYNRDAFNLESVDVLRGGAAMLFGRGQAGGVISQQSKTPKWEDGSSISVSGGENGFWRTSADINKKFSDNIAVRVNAVKQGGGSTRDDVKNETEGFAPSISYKPYDGGEITFSHFYLNTHITPDYGIPFFNREPLDVSNNTFYGFTNDYEDNKVNITTIAYTHKFSKDTELRSALRKADYLRDNWAIAAQSYNQATGAVSRSLKSQGAQEQVYDWQNDLNTKFETFGLKHEALFGTEFLHERQTRWGRTSIATAFPNISSASGGSYGLSGTGTKLANNGIFYTRTSATAAWAATLPDTVASPSSTLPSGYESWYGEKGRVISGRYLGKTIALYGQDIIEVAPGWKVMGGIRHDRLRMDYYDGTLTKTGELKYNENSYRAGISYEPTKNQHYYLAWNNSFNTTGDLYSFSNKYDPEKSITYELGAKWELFEGDLSLRASLYKTIKEWERNTDVESASASPILTKERHTDGLELEAAGRITDDWEIFAGLALMDPKVDEVAPGKSQVYKGQRPPNSATYTFNVWSTYKLDRNWKIGAGVDGKSDREVHAYGGTTFAPNKAPSFVKGDAMVSYSKKDYTIQLNVKNVLDTKYYDAVYINGAFVVPAIGRTAILSLDYRF